MPEQGYLLIAKLTDYTAFFVQSELDHAQAILTSLLKTLLKHVKQPLVAAKFKQDTTLFYALDGSFLHGQTMLETIENLYHVFRMAREQMQINTTCTCEACKRVPTLDLSFILHYGQFLRRNLGSYEIIASPDVIAIEGLAENSIELPAYTFITRTGAAAMNLGELADDMQPHHETLDQLGEIEGYVQDLHPIWTRNRERAENQLRICEEDALFALSVDLPASPALAWDYLTGIEHRQRWMQAATIDIVARHAARMDIGTVQRCAHGDEEEYLFNVMDWRPFEYVTYEIPVFAFGVIRHTVQLTPVEAGTHVDVFFAPLIWHNPPDNPDAIAAQVRALMSQRMGGGLEILRGLIEADIKTGKIAINTATDNTPP